MFCGWGGNGWGNNGNSGGVVDGYVLTSDFANVERKIDSVNQGLCDGFYQQAQLVNGTNMAMANGFAQAELSRSNQQAALMQQLNAMQMQNQECLKKLFTKVKDGLKSLLSFDSYKAVGTCAA